MLVLFNIPFTTQRPFRALQEAIGEEAIAWVGRTITMDGLKDLPARIKVVGGTFSFADVAHLEGDITYAATFNDPVDRVYCHWLNAANTPEHPHHVAANTYLLREIFEENHPFKEALSNAATQQLAAAGGPTPRAADALANLRQHRGVYGDGAHPKAFAISVAREVGIGDQDLDPEAFAPPAVERLRGEVRRIIMAANQEDIALIKGLQTNRKSKRPITRIKGGGGRRKAGPQQQPTATEGDGDETPKP